MNLQGSGLAITAVSGLWLGAFIVAFRGSGSAILRRLKFFSPSNGSSYGLSVVLSIALGMFVLSLWTLAVSTAGCLKTPFILAFLAAGVMLYVYEKKIVPPHLGRALLKLWQEGSAIDRLLFLAFVSLTASTFIGASAPETGNDALAYHLYFPKLYVQAGRLLNDIPHPRALWPGMMGMLYAAGLVLQGTVLAKLFSWLTAVLVLASVPATAHYFFQDKNAARASAFFAFFVPAVWMQSLYAYTDNAIALYSFLAFVSVAAWKKNGLTPRGLIVAGLFLSALLSIKIYTMTHTTVLIALILFFFAASGKGPVFFFKGLAVLTATCFLGAGFWFVRSWVLAGNPVFPFMGNVFGGNGFAQRMVGWAPAPKTGAGLVLLPWRLAMEPELFGGEPLGALFLAVAPLAFLAFKKKDFFALTAAAVAASYFLIWFLNIQAARFFFPVIPLAALFFGFVVSEWLKVKKPLTGMICGAVGILALAQFGLSNYYAWRMAPAGLGLVSSGTYLNRHERSYAFMKGIAPRLSPGDKILAINESRLYYAPVDTVLLSPLTDLQMKKENISFRQWLAREKITHVLTASRDKNALQAGLYLKDDHAARVAPIPMASGRSGDPQDPLYYALWILAG